MTGEEMERSIEFLLNSQASLEAKIEQTNDQVKQTSRQIEQMNRQIEQTNKRLDVYAETQSEFMQIVLRHIEAQGEINASLRSTTNDLSVAQQNLTVAQQRTEERLNSLAVAQQRTEERLNSLAAAQERTEEGLNSLIKTVDRYISERRDGKA
jgi:peptidoglycan hydrolase CwlO-like protein